MTLKDVVTSCYRDHRRVVKFMEFGVWDGDVSVQIVNRLRHDFDQVHCVLFGPVAPGMSEEDVANRIIKRTTGKSRLMIQPFFRALAPDMTKPRLPEPPIEIFNAVAGEFPAQDLMVIRGCNNIKAYVELWKAAKALFIESSTILIPSGGNEALLASLAASGKYSVTSMFSTNIAVIDDEKFSVVKPSSFRNQDD